MPDIKKATSLKTRCHLGAVYTKEVYCLRAYGTDTIKRLRLKREGGGGVVLGMKHCLKYKLQDEGRVFRFKKYDIILFILQNKKEISCVVL